MGSPVPPGGRRGTNSRQAGGQQSSPHILSYCTSKRWQFGINTVLEGEEILQPYINDWRKGGDENWGDGEEGSYQGAPNWLKEPLSGLARCPRSLGCQPRRATPSRVRGGEVMWAQLKIHLAANGKFTTEGHTYITFSRQREIWRLLQKKSERRG